MEKFISRDGWREGGARKEKESNSVDQAAEPGSEGSKRAKNAATIEDDVVCIVIIKLRVLEGSGDHSSNSDV